jgi:transcription antitermination factor NusG
MDTTRRTHAIDASHPTVPPPAADAAAAAWYAVWTRSQCEELVGDQLDAKGFRVLVPKALKWIRRGRQRRRHVVPIFPSYLFVHHPLDKHSHVEILKARGVVRLLGTDGSGPTPIPTPEIEAIQRVTTAGVLVFPHTYLTAGQRVRIRGGALAGLEGLLLRQRMEKGLLVISVDMLQRSVAVEVDCTLVDPA